MFLSVPSCSGEGPGNPVLTSTLLWKYTTDGMVASSPVVVGGVVYIGSGNGNRQPGDVGASPAFVGGIIYISSYYVGVHSLTGATGAELWKYNTDGQVA